MKKEKYIQTQIINGIKKKYPGAFVWKVSDQWYSGIPDIFFAMGTDYMFFEVKAEKGKLTPIQIQTHYLMFTKGIPVFTVRSKKETMNILERLLNG